MNLIDDTNPELGGNLNLNGYAVTDYSNGAIRFSSVPFDDIQMITTATGGIIFLTTATGLPSGPNADMAAVNLCVAQGSLTAPENTTASNYLGAWNVCGYYEGNWKNATGVISKWSDTANLTDNQPASSIALQTNAGGNAMNFAVFDERGVFTAPVFSATTYSTESLPVNPNPGWMAFDNTTNQFKGWNGTDWVVLG